MKSCVQQLVAQGAVSVVFEVRAVGVDEYTPAHLLAAVRAGEPVAPAGS